MRNSSLNKTDKITIIYNTVVVIFVFIFRAKIAAYGCHLAFNLSVILLVLSLGLWNSGAPWNPKDSRDSVLEIPEEFLRVLVRTVSMWYPLALYALLYYQTGLINRVVIPVFMDDFFMNLDIRIFGKFPWFFLGGAYRNSFLDEFFHFFYFSYYLIIPLTAILLYRKDTKLFERFIFQLSCLFYVCYIIYIFLPVEGPFALRNEYYLQHGLFREIVDFVYSAGENPGAAFPSSHVAITFLVAWWGSKHFKKLRIFYWLTCLFLSISTVYCLFHYAVDVLAGLLLGILAVLIFEWADKRHFRRESVCS
jgi:membrane-associated phospholipid phosphatase